MDLTTATVESISNVTTTAATATASSSAPPIPFVLRALGDATSKLICAGWLPVKLPQVDECEPTLGLAVIAVLLAPLIWNTIARLQYYTKCVSFFLGRRVGTIVLGIWIFSFSLYRDALVAYAIRQQPRAAHWDDVVVHLVGGLCGVLGATFVLSSYYKLGFWGTYLADYFGILMDEMVTGFPFNVTDHPMYDGSTLLFFSMGVLEKSPAGIAVSAWVFTVYRVFAIFESNFTSFIYATAAAEKKARTKKE